MMPHRNAPEYLALSWKVGLLPDGEKSDKMIVGFIVTKIVS